MMVLKAEDARKETDNYNESKKIREYQKSLSQAEQQKMHNIFNSIKKATIQGDNSIVVDPTYLTDGMLNMFTYLGYTITNSELAW